MPPKHTGIALRHTQTGCGLLDGGRGHRWLQTLLGLHEARSTHTRIRPQAFALMLPHSCKGHTSNRTRSNRDAKGQPSAPVDKATNMRHRPHIRLNSPLSQPHELVRSAGSRVPADSAPGLRTAGAPKSCTQPKSLDTQCHAHSVQPTPAPTPILAAPREERRTG